MNKRLAWLLFCLFFLLSACAFSDPSPDAWQNGSPGGAPPEATPIAQDSIFMVQVEQNSAALARLEDESAILLSESEARKFVGDLYHDKPNSKPYLVRALVKCCLASSFVSRLGDDLYVWSMAMGEPTYQRTALVVNLDFDPETVYVSLGFVQ